MTYLPPNRQRMLPAPYVEIRHCQTSRKLSLGDGHGRTAVGDRESQIFRVVRRRAMEGNEHVSLGVKGIFVAVS